MARLHFYEVNMLANSWLSPFAPDLYVESIYEIDLQQLAARGVKGIITDLDNTLVAWDTPQATPTLVDWLDDLKRRGLQVCIVSNNKATRVNEFARPLGIPAIYQARKPSTAAFQQAMKQMGTLPTETVVIGDQVFTDVLGGNRMGLYTILVVPISDKEWLGTKVLRAMERIVMRSMKKRGLIPWKD